MTVAFIGDVHGEIGQLRSVLSGLPDDVERVVFLGDYVNRGKRSSDVIELVAALAVEQPTRFNFLEGHHDASFRRALDDGDLANFLAMGGAETIKDYLPEVPDDVLSALRAAVPESHRKFLRELKESAEGDGWVAAHQWRPHSPDVFGVFGHSVQGTMEPWITQTDALIDTGCGTLNGGPLTAFFFPAGTWIQA